MSSLLIYPGRTAAFSYSINLRTYKEEGVDGTSPWVFDMLQYFEKILPLLESL